MSLYKTSTLSPCSKLYSSFRNCIESKALTQIILLFLAFVSVFAYAEDDEDEFRIRIQDISNAFDHQLLGGMTARLQPLGSDLMGDQIDKKTGGLTFEHLDIELPGNSSLEVALRRKLVQGAKYNSPHQQAFGDWVLDIPIAHVAFSPKSGGNPTFNNGCLQSFGGVGHAGTTIYHNGSSILVPHGVHTDGLTLSIPGKGLSGFQGKPKNDMNLSDPAANWVSGGRENDYANRCSQVVIAPDGTKYRFGLADIRRAKDLNIPVTTVSSRHFGGELHFNIGLNRNYAVLLLTEVEDIYGNWVRYDYTNDSRAELTRIYSNDGRDIRVNYSSTLPFSTRNSRLVSSITANGRTWNYGYDGWVLSTVTLPDGRKWGFDEGADTPMRAMEFDVYEHWNCVPQDRSFSIKHPDGAKGTFVLRETRHLKNQIDYGSDPDGTYIRARNYSAPSETRSSMCWSPSGGNEILPPYGMPFYRVMSVQSKTITGSNIETARWDFDYRGYRGGAIDSTWTKITEPDGTEKTYTYDTIGRSHGLLTEILIEGVRGETHKTTYEYDVSQSADPNCGAGGEYGDETGACLAFAKRPYTKKVISTDGERYTTEKSYNRDSSNTFRDFGKPNRVKQYSTLQSGTRITDISYWHNQTKNIIGLTARVVKNGKEFVQNHYNGNGQRTRLEWMNASWETYGYYSNGLLSRVTDARGNSATFSSYYRGIPRTIVRRDGKIIRKVVDANGWITSETDPKNTTIKYAYTNMGLLKKIDLPSPWTDTNIHYHNLGKSSFYRRIVTGSKEVAEYYNEMRSPYRIRTRALNGGGVTSYVKIDYDNLGRVIFESRPGSSGHTSNGTHTEYDALGRVVSVRDSNLANGLTTDYLSGNRQKVTDALGYITITERSGYASPSDGSVVQISSPEYVSTSSTYDIYGNILSMTQGGYSAGITKFSTQRWSYDSRLRLCRHYVPETGSKLFRYDSANNITGYSEGNSGTSGCSTLPSNTTVILSYDKLNQNKLINYPDSTPDISITYNENGKVLTKNRGGVNWSYTYDNLDNLTREQLYIDGKNYLATYNYNGSQALSRFRSPSGRVVDYAPNGLGQATKIAYTAYNKVFANNATYHLDSSLKSFNYGNGIYFSRELNNRYLPSKIKAIYGGQRFVEQSYSYDNNAQLKSIVDSAVSGQNRTMTYDGLGRLKTANGPWGSGTFKYDALGNLRVKKLGARTVTLDYNSLNRLSRFKDSSKGNGAYQSFYYDSRGNVLDNGTASLGGLRFTYDLSNQPTKVNDSSIGTYVYDGNFKRVKQTVDGKTIYSFYSQNGKLLYRDNLSNQADRSDHYYLADTPVLRIKGGGSTYKEIYLHTDLLNSPIATTSNSRQLQWRESYTPFGEKTIGDSRSIDETGFTGHVEDSTGLVYMQARYYDPVIGRFYSNDPVGYTAKNPVMSFNRYMYVNNNPYKYKDPNGEFLAGAFFSAALDVGIQLIENGGDITKVDPAQTAIAFVTGAVGAGIGEKIAKAGSLVAKATNSKVAGATVDITGNTVAAGSIEGVKEGVLATADALSGSDLAAGDATSDVLTGTRDGLVGSTANQVVSNATGNSKLGQLAEFGASAVAAVLDADEKEQ